MDNISLCDNFTIVVVGGLGAQEQELMDAAWDIAEYLHNLKKSERGMKNIRIEIIVNSSKSLFGCCETDIQRLLELIHTPACYTGNITHVIFAHSMGTRIVSKALSTRSLEKYYRTQMPEETSCDDVLSVRQKIAIISLGGVDDTPQAASNKLTLNIRLSSDIKAYMARAFFGKSHGEAMSKVAPLNEEPKAESWLLQWCWCCFCTPNAPVARSFAEGQTHAIKDYTRRTELMFYLSKVLGIKNDGSSATRCDCNAECIEYVTEV